jgi:hypothetical protein
MHVAARYGSMRMLQVLFENSDFDLAITDLGGV